MYPQGYTEVLQGVHERKWKMEKLDTVQSKCAQDALISSLSLLSIFVMLYSSIYSSNGGLSFSHSIGWIPRMSKTSTFRDSKVQQKQQIYKLKTHFELVDLLLLYDTGMAKQGKIWRYEVSTRQQRYVRYSFLSNMLQSGGKGGTKRATEEPLV